MAPLLDEELARRLLADAADASLAAALDVGLLVDRNSRLDLHPLARLFLDGRWDELDDESREAAVDICLDSYLKAREWDAAFELLGKHRTDRLDGLLLLALDELLDTARLSTIGAWCDRASDCGVTGPAIALARSEVALRYGRHAEAIAHAEIAAVTKGELTFRSLSLAGRAAHLASREDQAFAAYQRAEAAAESEAQAQEAKWGQLMCAIELESPVADEWIAELHAGVSPSDPREIVRDAAIGLSFQVKLADLDLTDADSAASLVDLVDDPLVVSAFQSTYSAMLGLTARYNDAREVVDAFYETIRRYRLDFALTYALCADSVAWAGLRRWREAEASAREALNRASDARDVHAQQICISQLTRVLVQQGRQLEALDLELPVARSPLASVQAEAVAARALALASLGQVRKARELEELVTGASRAIEPAALLAATSAVRALKTHDPDAVERVLDLEEVCLTRGALDLLVTAYRSTPELLSVLLRVSRHQERIRGLIRRAGDDDLAEFLGHSVSAAADPRQTLTPRERDVYDLIVQGLTNREIARLLFVEQSTVKVHAHHIYEKVGVQGRKALIAYAMLERSSQATSAIDTSPDGSSEL